MENYNFIFKDVIGPKINRTGMLMEQVDNGWKK
jgi:hypothetical protein